MQGGVSLSGMVPTLTPQTVANLWLSYGITHAVTASAGVRHVGQTYADAANTSTGLHTPCLTWALAWKITHGTTLTGRIRNATDRIYGAEARAPARSTWVRRALWT